MPGGVSPVFLAGLGLNAESEWLPGLSKASSLSSIAPSAFDTGGEALKALRLRKVAALGVVCLLSSGRSSCCRFCPLAAGGFGSTVRPCARWSKVGRASLNARTSSPSLVFLRNLFGSSFERHKGQSPCDVRRRRIQSEQNVCSQLVIRGSWKKSLHTSHLSWDSMACNGAKGVRSQSEESSTSLTFTIAAVHKTQTLEHTYVHGPNLAFNA